MALLFVIGYAGIIFEESLAFNKSGVGLLMAVSLWVIRSIGVRFELLIKQSMTLLITDQTNIVWIGWFGEKLLRIF